MSTAMEQYDWKNITYSKALEFARIPPDAFSEDALMRVFWPEESQFAPSALPPIAEYEQLIQRAKQFKRLSECEARRLHLLVRSDPRVRLFLLKDPKGKYVAGAQWILPKYLPQTQPSLLHRLKTWILARWYALRDLWSMWGYKNPNDDPALCAEVRNSRIELGVKDTPERTNELFSLNPKQLKETTYPKDYTYYLRLLATRKSEQRKGYGEQLAKESLHALRPFKRPPHFIGPPKATLISSPSARGFYMRLGYSLGAVYEHELPNGEWFPYTYFFLNLRDKI